jgi:ribonuclease HII
MRRLSGNTEIDNWDGHIVASDECGYGSWAGTLVVCAASAPIGWEDARVKDSKQVSEAARERLFEEFSKDLRFPHKIVVIQAEIVDRMGAGQALLYAHKEALKEVVGLLQGPVLGVVDGTLPVSTFGVGCPLKALPKADQLVPECSLASILAKVTRDRMMVELDAKYPGYDFAASRGYGTPRHHEALKRLGPCPEHRRSFTPVAAVVQQREAIEEPDWFSIMDKLGTD